MTLSGISNDNSLVHRSQHASAAAVAPISAEELSNNSSKSKNAEKPQSAHAKPHLNYNVIKEVQYRAVSVEFVALAFLALGIVHLLLLIFQARGEAINWSFLCLAGLPYAFFCIEAAISVYYPWIAFTLSFLSFPFAFYFPS